ncbi:hypothetical protein CN469_04415 [Bacillus cereus]|nr:hypothetical protein CN469_04415 [Bacillus cereus]
MYTYYTKIQNSPYYKLIKEEYWEQTYSLVLGPSQKRSYSYVTGTSSVDQTRMTNTLNIEIGADFGLKFNNVTSNISGKITKTIQTEVSSTNQQSVSETKSDEISNDTSNYTIGFTQYQLVTKYTLYRMDGTAVSNPFISKNDKIAISNRLRNPQVCCNIIANKKRGRINLFSLFFYLFTYIFTAYSCFYLFSF